MTVTFVAGGVTCYHRADREFAERLANEPDQYVVNRRRARESRPATYTLHHRDCPSVSSTSSTQNTANPKWCGTRAALEAWVRTETGAGPGLCTHCFD